MKTTVLIAVLSLVLACSATASQNKSKKAVKAKPAAKAVTLPKTIHCAVMTGKVIDVAMATRGHDYADYKGRRYFFCCGSCPEEFKSNPEAYAKNASIPIPPSTGKEKPAPELTSATIVGAYWYGAPELPDWINSHHVQGVDLILPIKEYYTDLPHTQLKSFYRLASHNFVLRAPGQPDIKLELADWNASDGSGKFQAYGVHIADEDRTKLVEGVDYRLVPVESGTAKHWKVLARVVVRWH